MIHRFVATVGKEAREVAVEPLDGGAFRVTVDGRARVIDAARVGEGAWSLAEAGGGAQRLVDVDGAGGDFTVALAGATLAVKLVDARRALAAKLSPPRAATGPEPVRAPMPGKVVKVLVKAGDAVKAGQGVAVVEAMKMENELRAPRDGTVVEVAARDGQAVEAGQPLVTIG